MSLAPAKLGDDCPGPTLEEQEAFPPVTQMRDFLTKARTQSMLPLWEVPGDGKEVGVERLVLGVGSVGSRKKEEVGRNGLRWLL